MKRLNDYFLNVEQRKEKKQWISLCGKLEAIIGNYFLSGAGTPDEKMSPLKQRNFILIEKWRFHDFYNLLFG